MTIISFDPFNPDPTPEQINKMFSGMDDSVWLINTDCDNGPRPTQTQLNLNQEIDRNTRHLKLMLSKPYIQDAGRPLGTYEEAIVRGEAYIADHGGLTEGGSSAE